jgi:4-amino-4-deoxy-L-arabinose transferase-like glycosyltransferase
MAIFGEVFGDSNRYYSTVFFAILSILALYLLTFELTGNGLLAWSVGALLALTPLHAFFSKFPATEVVA